jgi:Ca2+-binding EF-hand superfamily protein
MLLPCEDNCLRKLTLDRPACRVGRHDVLPRDIEHAILEVIEKELDLARHLEVLKHDLECRYDYSTLAAFRSVDKFNDGKIDTLNLGAFFRNVDHYATERELLQIVRRMDTDGDARLTYSEFADFVRSACAPREHVHHVAEDSP